MQQAPQIQAKGLRAAQLVRLSTEEQNALGRAGLQAQYEQTNATIAANGYQLVASIELVNVSGTSVAHAPEFQRLLALVRDGLQVVVVSEISRLIRPESLESLAVLDVFARHNCLINAGGTLIDFENPDGFLAGALHAVLAGHSRMTLLRKVQAAKEINRRRGWLATSHKCLPLGVSYDKSTRKFFYNEAIHRVVEGFRLMDEERLSLSEVGRRIGVHPGNVRGLLEQEIYATGYRVYSKKCDLSVKRVGVGGKQRARPRIARAPDEIIRVKVIDIPAVPIERLKRVQEALKEIRLNYTTTNTRARQPTLCSVIGRCGACGLPLYVSVNGKRRKDGGKGAGYYMCKGHYPAYAGTVPKCSSGWIRRPLLDRVMVAFFQETLTNPDLLSAIISGSMKRCAAKVLPFTSPTAQEAIEKLKKRDARLLAMCEQGVITISEFRERRAKLNKEIQLLREASSKTHRPDTELSVERLAQLVVRAVRGFNRIADPAAQKSILREVFHEVFFLGESISAFSFSASFVAELGDGAGLSTGTIHLETPFRLRPPVPEGQKRCSCCGICQSRDQFYKKRAQCCACLRKKRTNRRCARQSPQKQPS
jgi:DNA invertase Pin-like site-specific DNA recombinase